MSLGNCHMYSTRVSDGNSAGLTLYSDDESDLIRELQTLCSSKSEPDISKVIQYYKIASCLYLLYTVNSETVSIMQCSAQKPVEHQKSLLSRYGFKACTYPLLQIAVSQEDFIMLPGPSQDAHRRKVEHGYTGLQAHASREYSSLDSAQPPVQQVTPAWIYRISTSLPEIFTVF